MVKYMESVPNKSTTGTCSMLYTVLMALGEVDLVLGPSLFPPIIKAIMVDHMVLIFMVITEVDKGTTLVNFLHITMVD